MKKQLKKKIMLGAVLIGFTASLTVNASMTSPNIESERLTYKQQCYSSLLTPELISMEDKISVLELENEVLKIKNNSLENTIKELKIENELLKAEKEKNDKLNTLTFEEWEVLYRVARAEAGSWSKEGQKNVVYIVLNRMNSEEFPDTIEEVIFQTKPAKQFACVWDGNFYKVEISDFTIENVQEAYLDYVEGESADGALFFTLGKFSYEYLFTDEVGHNFYK